MSHRAFVLLAKQERAFPKTENAVPAEGRHETNRALVIEERRVPPNCLFDIRTAGVHDFTQLFEDRLRERRRAPDVSVNSRISSRHQS